MMSSTEQHTVEIHALPYDDALAATAKKWDRRAHRFYYSKDRLLRRLHLGGRRGDYDDVNFCFEGGVGDSLRKKHYDKSLRLLWKAEMETPWADFKDATKLENSLETMALRAMTEEELAERTRINSAEFRQFLRDAYTPEQREAMVNILALLTHGEAYAWLVSNEVLRSVRSTGGKAAATMQVFEEAKHFLVLRELTLAFEMPVPPMLTAEYLATERALKTPGVEKFFGMNFMLEAFALGFFSTLCKLPGMEVLRLFHRDEARHAALPMNYFREFPLSPLQRYNLRAKVRRLSTLILMLPAIFVLDKDFAVMGIDVCEIAGSTFKKILANTRSVGYDLAIPARTMAKLVNGFMNRYRKRVNPLHEWRDFLNAEVSSGEMKAAEDAVYPVAHIA